MPIDFTCNGCANQLRVSDESAGKDARCPKCGAINRVPGVSPATFSPPSVPVPTPEKKDWLFSEAGSAATSSNPFGAGPVNPYAAPQASSYAPDSPSLPITPTVVGVDPIFNYAWQLWQQNLGLLIGVYITIIAISYAVGIPLGFAQLAIEQNNGREAGVAFNLVTQIISWVLQTFLQIGFSRIALKLARRQPAEFTDLFSGGPQFLPVLGVSLLVGLAVGFGFVLLIVPGIILALMLWPAYYVVLEGKAGIIESFSVASTISKGNWGTAFLLSLLAFVIGLVGILALCIGVIFAAPLAMLLFPIAYLMMAGQIPAYAQQAQYPAYGKP